MKAVDCKWFACVYARKSDCVIQGYMEEPNKYTGEKEVCPHHDKPGCIRVRCKYCSRENQVGICPLTGVKDGDVQ